MSEQGANDKENAAANVDELEIKVAFLEDSMAKLSDEFYLQQRALDDLKAKYNLLVDKVINKSADDGMDTQILDERPPHY